MSQEEPQPANSCQQLQPSASIRRRRTPKSAHGHRFVCQCGKSYMSYPAIYTHNKYKHKDSVLNYVETELAEESEKSGEVGLDLADQHNIEFSEGLSALRMYLDRFLTNKDIEKWFHFGTHLEKKRERDWLHEAKVYWSAHRLQQENRQHNQLLQTSIDNVLGLFLQATQQQVGETYLGFMKQFAEALRRSVNLVCKRQDYTSGQSAEGLPWIMNDVVERMMKEEIQESYQEKRTLACRWLNQQLFTSAQLKLNLA